MTAARLYAISFGSPDPRRLASFWSGVLDRPIGPGGMTLPPTGDGEIRIRFRETDEPKTGPNRAHFDLTSRSLDDQREIVARALALGARHIDVGQRPEEGHVVLADPDDNEFCVVEPGNNFLAGCGAVGALSCDGSRATGLFWSETLGWPLVWDEGEETAIQSPRGGTKISWGGPAARPKTGRNRVILELIARGEVGGTKTQERRAYVEKTDPDGNEFRVLRSVHDAAGGRDGLMRLAAAWHERVLADEVVSHAFSHGYHPRHTERLAAYWAEALGGPPAYTESYGDETSVVRMHSGNGPHDDMNRRAIDCFDGALADAGLTEEPLRQVLHDYFAWSTLESMNRYHRSADDVPPGLPVPRWSWEGREPQVRPPENRQPD
ncbi:VOC family protein [Actinoplanes sp. CA-030573]|uniref:VOC family protein n=1 Tax=Actinoplanes sp. CA-030573 TaxID=3239898 RepID=UPI003D8BDB85